MARYLVIASYNADGLHGLLAHGGSARVEAAREVVAEVGGTVESFDFALGADDAYIICDLPDNVAATAVSIAAAGSGMLVNRTVVLVTPEDVDRAAAARLTFRPPAS